MNKKYILKNEDGKTVYCILDAEKNEKDEFERVFGIEKGYGLTAEKFGDKIFIRNYYRGDNVASFMIIAIKDTNEEKLYQLMPLEY